jgi:proteic killer suppression protein
MIVNFAHKGLKRFYEVGDRSKLAAELVDRIAVILAALDEAAAVTDLDRPSFRLHQLKGDLRGHWSITVRANWRITFTFDDGDVSDVDFVDYH